MRRKNTALIIKHGQVKPKVTPWTRWITASREMAGLDQSEFAPYIGRTRSTLANYETGITIPPPDVIAAIKTNFPLSPAAPDEGSNLVVTGQSLGSGVYGRLPYAGTVPASSSWGDPLSDSDLREIEPKFVGPGRFIAKVSGDSCYPALQQGDLTIWEVDESPAYGLIVLAERLTDQACTVKELKRLDNRDCLVPVNPESKPPPNDEGWMIRAKLIGVIANQDIEEQWFEARGLRADIMARKRRN